MGMGSQLWGCVRGYTLCRTQAEGVGMGPQLWCWVRVTFSVELKQVLELALYREHHAIVFGKMYHESRVSVKF